MTPTLSSMFPLATDVLAWAIVIHLVVDWLLQNEWMACNKMNLKHPAAYVHSGLHAIGLLLVFPWYLALGVGVTHLLIDTRRPVTWWIAKIKQMPRTVPIYKDIEIWMDQIFHLLMLVLAVVLIPFML